MTFRKDDEPHGVNIFKNIKSGRPGYSNAWNILFQSTLRRSTCWRGLSKSARQYFYPIALSYLIIIALENFFLI